MLCLACLFYFFFLGFSSTSELFLLRLFILLLFVGFLDDEILLSLPRGLLGLELVLMIFLVFGFRGKMMILRWLVLRVMMLFLLVPSIFFLALVRLCRIQGFCLVLLRLVLFDFHLFCDCLFIFNSLFGVFKVYLIVDGNFLASFFMVLEYFKKFSHYLNCLEYRQPCSFGFQNFFNLVLKIMRSYFLLFFYLRLFQTLDHVDFLHDFHQS